jgi:hypothetical protein
MSDFKSQQEMTKPLDQVKSEFNDKNEVFVQQIYQEFQEWDEIDGAIPTEEMPLRDVFLVGAIEGAKIGFDAAISHLASLGVSGARKELIVYDRTGNFKKKKNNIESDDLFIDFIEHLPVAAQLAKQAEEIEGLKAELKEVKSLYDKKLTECMNQANQLDLKDKKFDDILKVCKNHTDYMWAAQIVSTITGYDFRDAEQYFKDKGE